MILLISGRYEILLDDEDQDKLTGLTFSIVGTGYVLTYNKVTKEYVYLHRLVMEVSSRSIDVDHINGNKLDNRKENLRRCTRSQNLHNAVRPSTKRDGLPKGVYKHSDPKRKKPYQVKFKFEGTWVCYGYYKTVEEATSAYLKAIEFYCGQFAFHLNRS